MEMIEAEPVATTELEPEAPSAPNLFLTHDPETFLARASEAASALARVIHERKLYTRIRGKEHVHVEGWTLLGSLLGVFPITEWTRRIDEGWEARVVAKTRAGELVGAAESMCTPKESKWRNADEFAIRSMAATRATSKALRLPLGFIMELAGFDPTPFEETTAERVERDQDEPSAVTRYEAASAEQKDEIAALLRSLGQIDPEQDWRAVARGVAGSSAGTLSRGQADTVRNRLRERLASYDR